MTYCVCGFYATGLDNETLLCPYCRIPLKLLGGPVINDPPQSMVEAMNIALHGVFEFAGPLATEHWPDHLTLVFPERNVSVVLGDYLFKARNGIINLRVSL